MTITYKGGGHPRGRRRRPPYPTNYNPRQLGPRPAYGFFVRHVRGLQFRNVKVAFESPDHRPAFATVDVQGLSFDGVQAQRPGEQAPRPWPERRPQGSSLS